MITKKLTNRQQSDLLTAKMFLPHVTVDSEVASLVDLDLRGEWVLSWICRKTTVLGSQTVRRRRSEHLSTLVAPETSTEQRPLMFL